MAEAAIIQDGWDADDAGDPDAKPPASRKLVTQPYDLTIGALLDQIERKVLHLKPLSGRPRFQRRYVWKDGLASRLIESMLLNVPIPPCYFAQDDDFDNEVIDGQQRLYSLYRFVDNQFKLTGLENLLELNGLRFFELPAQSRTRLLGYTLRCVVITNDSDKDLRFDVFERLNSNTVPLNSQELRNCVYRGSLIELIGDLAAEPIWLEVFGRRAPDPRMKDEELILRYFAFKLKGLDSYRTPQKFWLNHAADEGQDLPPSDIEAMRVEWLTGLENCRNIFGKDCFRRPRENGKRQPINKALVDLNMLSLGGVPQSQAIAKAEKYREIQDILLASDDFSDLIGRAVDHKSRTDKRFKLWNDSMAKIGLKAE